MIRKTSRTGIKDQQRTDVIDRLAPYRAMRREFHKDTPHTTDVDQIEWVFVPQEGWVAVTVLEVTLREFEGYGPVPPPGYFAQILERYEQDGAQGSLARKVAYGLGCKAFLVVCNEDAQTLWVYDLLCTPRGEGPWYRKTREEYQLWLFGLKQVKLREYS